jgi:transcriptional regulator with XRE-family HTH domain
MLLDGRDEQAGERSGKCDFHEAPFVGAALTCRRRVQDAVFPSALLRSTTWQVVMERQSTFASRLAGWRKKRALSQLQLALAASCSQRHVSFLELGRTQPSRDMVLRLSAVLDLPLRQSNELLLAAGFAAVWSECNFDDAALAPARQALDHILAQQEPFPAVVVDRRWNLLQANSGAVRLVEFLVGPIEEGAPINLADALVGPDVLRPYLSNWADVVSYFVGTVEADATADGSAETAALLERLISYPDVRAAQAEIIPPVLEGPILPMHFVKDGVRLSLFTTIATLGTPQDITLQELRIESFFPMDADTGQVFQDWATASAKSDNHAV